MKTLNMLSLLFPLQKNSSFLVTLVQELDKTAYWEGVLGKQGTGKCNSICLLLLQTCAKRDFLINNTIFCFPTRNKTSWMHPRSKRLHLNNYVIVRGRDRLDVRVTRAVCGAKCWTDHRLIISKLSIRVQPNTRPRGKKKKKKKKKSTQATEHHKTKRHSTPSYRLLRP